MDCVIDEPGGDLGAASHVQTVEEVGEIVFDGFLAQVELSADFLVGETLAQEREDLLMSGREMWGRLLWRFRLSAYPLQGGAHESMIKGRFSCQRLCDDSWHLSRGDRFKNTS